jgi:hypothetical protein
MKGQLACPEVAAGQHLMARRGGGDPDPGVPALALGAWPAERTSRPQHVGLPALLEELTQLRAAAIDLIQVGITVGCTFG